MNKLIVYFSYTNNTRTIANKIKDKLNCDILEIKTKIPYITYRRKKLWLFLKVQELQSSHR